MPKINPLNLVHNAKDKPSDSELVANSEAEAEYELDEKTDLFSEIFATEANQSQKQQKKNHKTSRSDVAKHANLSIKIFDYIHVARCHRLFFLTWYDDLTSAQSKDSLSKSLPTSCCNRQSCNSVEPDYLQQASFIDKTTVKVTEVDRKWMAYRTLALKQLRLKTFV